MDYVEEKCEELECGRPAHWSAGQLLRVAVIAAACAGFTAAAWSAFAAEDSSGLLPAQVEGHQAVGTQLGAQEEVSRPRTLEAGRIVLVDRWGREGMELVAGDAGPSVTLFDKNGKKRLELRVTDDAPIVGLMDPEENERASVRLFLAVFGHGSTELGEVLRVYEGAGLLRTHAVRSEIEATHAATALRWVSGEKAAVVTSIGPGAGDHPGMTHTNPDLQGFVG